MAVGQPRRLVAARSLRRHPAPQRAGQFAALAPIRKLLGPASLVTSRPSAPFCMREPHRPTTPIDGAGPIPQAFSERRPARVRAGADWRDSRPAQAPYLGTQSQQAYHLSAECRCAAAAQRPLPTAQSSRPTSTSSANCITGGPAWRRSANCRHTGALAYRGRRPKQRAIDRPSGGARLALASRLSRRPIVPKPPRSGATPETCSAAQAVRNAPARRLTSAPAAGATAAQGTRRLPGNCPLPRGCRKRAKFIGQAGGARNVTGCVCACVAIPSGPRCARRGAG